MSFSSSWSSWLGKQYRGHGAPHLAGPVDAALERLVEKGRTDVSLIVNAVEPHYRPALDRKRVAVLHAIEIDDRHRDNTRIVHLVVVPGPVRVKRLAIANAGVYSTLGRTAHVAGLKVQNVAD